MRGEKVIDLGFEIRYSERGVYTSTNIITVREPGLSKRAVWAAMKAYVAEAQPKLLKLAIELQGLAKQAGGIDVQGDEEAAQAEDGTAPEKEQDVMQWMGQALGPERFGVFVEFVQKALTNSPMLATVGDGKAPITEEVWTELETHGGMDSINRVMSEFTSFFFGGPQASAKTNGASSSPTSDSLPPDSSPTKRRATSRSVN